MTNISTRRCVTAVLALILLLAGAGQSIQAAPPLRALIMETEPWGFYDPEQGRMQGIWIDIAEAIQARSHLQHELRLAPYARVVESLRLGDADLSYLIRAPARDEEVHHAGFLFNFGSVVQVREGTQLESYEDLSRLRIGVLQGIRLSPQFDADDSLDKVYLRNYETMINMFIHGRLDAISGNSLSLSYLTRKMGAEPVLGSRLVLQATPVTVQFSRHYSDVAVMEQTEAAVDRLREEGVIEAILNRWAGEGWAVDVDTQP